MNGRKARARRRARQRSQESNRWRRKDAGVEVTDRQRELRAELHAATVQREQLLKSADEAFRKALKVIEETRRDTVAAAWADYDKARAKIVKKMAEEEQAAA
jgi:hypothetical protein